MGNNPASNRAPLVLSIVGICLIVFGLARRSSLIDKARSDARVDEMFDDMIGSPSGFHPDYGDANAMLWAVGIGILLLAVALTVQLVRRGQRPSASPE